MTSENSNIGCWYALWGVGTLEWTISSPPPHYNYKDIPVVYQGPHEFNNPAIPEEWGRDFLYQSEKLPGDPTEDERVAMTHTVGPGGEVAQH